MTPRGCFVTGTDTGAGKTILVAALAAALVASGKRVAAFKPAVTGSDDASAADPWPADHELLAAVTGARPAAVTPHVFAVAAAPHLAAELAGKPQLSLRSLVASARAAAAGADVLVVEGVGGLLVPLAHDVSVRDLAVALGLGLVVAARPGLGTINHCLLTVEAARAAGLAVQAIVMGPWPERPTALERSNRQTVQRLTGVEVVTLPFVERADLAAAGARLPYEAWLGRPDR